MQTIHTYPSAAPAARARHRHCVDRGARRARHGVEGSGLSGAFHGARTCWHKHPFGQVLLLEAGKALVQVEGEEAREAGPGKTIVCEPAVWHWHEAAPEHTFTPARHHPCRRHRRVRHLGGPRHWVVRVPTRLMAGPRACSACTPRR